ncbi:uncharacterized protein LOC113558773, partial [Rhopalosiphum maidis]|uniref:uncharacterized protein LOC113558773 n=1 Tax=Rhopalosiphum maidis TaxID=43146 RepID=UPI000EFF1AEF
FKIIFNMYHFREYCALNNPITNLFMKSNGLLVLDLKKNKGRPDIVKLRLPLTLNEVFNGTIKLVKIKKNSDFICDSMENEKRVLKIKIPRGFPTGGTLKSEISKLDIGHNNIKSIVTHIIY